MCICRSFTRQIRTNRSHHSDDQNRSLPPPTRLNCDHRFGRRLLTFRPTISVHRHRSMPAISHVSFFMRASSSVHPQLREPGAYSGCALFAHEATFGITQSHQNVPTQKTMTADSRLEASAFISSDPRTFNSPISARTLITPHGFVRLLSARLLLCINIAVICSAIYMFAKCQNAIKLEKRRWGGS